MYSFRRLIVRPARNPLPPCFPTMMCAWQLVKPLSKTALTCRAPPLLNVRVTIIF